VNIVFVRSDVCKLLSSAAFGYQWYVFSVPYLLSCIFCPVFCVLYLLSCMYYPVFSVLYLLSCILCPVFTVVYFLSFTFCPVLLSYTFCPVRPEFLSCTFVLYFFHVRLFCIFCPSLSVQYFSVLCCRTRSEGDDLLIFFYNNASYM
jgi:hypothetical protein